MRYRIGVFAIFCLGLGIILASAQSGVVSCAQFKARLKSAGKTMGIDVPPPIYEPSYISKIDPEEQWYIVNYKDHEATLVCRKTGAFESLQIFGPFKGTGTEADFFTNPMSINLVSAGIFAFTGWPSTRTDEARTKLMVGALNKMREAKAKGSPSKGETVPLPSGFAHIDSGIGGFTLLLEVKDREN